MKRIIKKTTVFLLLTALFATAVLLSSCSGGKNDARETSANSANSANNVTSVTSGKGGSGDESYSHSVEDSGYAGSDGSYSEEASASADTSDGDYTVLPPMLSIGEENAIYSSGDLKASLITFGRDVTEITIAAAIVPENRYSYDGETLTISGEYLATFDKAGKFRLRVVTTDGRADAYFTINDVPVLKEKTDFIKYPGESVKGESFKKYVSDEFGKLSYRYSLAAKYADKGVLSDKGDGTFDFTPNGVYYGEVGIVFDVSDEYGAAASAEFTLVYKRIDPVIYDAATKTFDKAVDTEDLVFKVDTFGKEKNSELYFDMTDVLSGGASIGSDNYILKANGNKKYFAIKADYLKNVTVGRRKFSLTTTAGSADFYITVSDSGSVEVDRSAITFVKGEDDDDVTINVDPRGNAVTAESFSIEGVATGEGMVYENRVLTLKKEFLAGLDAGVYMIKINGEDKIKLTVSETAPVLPSVEAVGEGFYIDAYNDVTFSVDLKGNTFVGLLYGEEALVRGDDYDFDDGVLVIKASKLTSIFRFGKSEYVFRLDVEENGGAEFTVNYEDAENRVLNGGFETGDLYGWNAYRIWNDESGVAAWTNDRVVSGTYFDDKYSYDRDGEYNLGVYGGSISKDSGQERMGHLRSSNFVLGGSGWISFKLGGGRNPQFAYVSVRKASDDTEIARFGNRHFNDATKLPDNNSADGTKKNAEAYLFRYYYDLSDHLGEELYFVISDTSSNHWCVLSADSFFTYYKTAPSVSDDTLAQNILPTVKGIGSSINGIKGGYPFESATFSEYWTIDGKGWGLNGDAAYSNVDNGNSGSGVLRSATFNVNGENKYLRFGFGGTRYYDKTIFVSVKEANTNIEVKRFVLRANLRGDKGTGTNDIDSHMCDLTDLDANKEYYLEFCDNETGSWGIFIVKNVRLVDEALWNEKPKGDRAVEISGIVTDYSYALPY